MAMNDNDRAVPCPECRDEMGYLFASRGYPGLLHCNGCGEYFTRSTRGALVQCSVKLLPEKVGRTFCSTEAGG